MSTANFSMKGLIIFVGAMFVHNLYAQINCIYKVVNTSQSPKMGMSSELEIEMEVSQENDYSLIETRFIDTDGKLTYSGEIKAVLVNRKINLVYSYDENLSILESYHLLTDTLIATGKKAKYGSYLCEIYTVKNKPSVKLYCCKKLRMDVNPGIRYYSEKPVGGIARIEILRKESTLIYQLVRMNKVQSVLDPYLNKIKDYTREPVDSRSILGK